MIRKYITFLFFTALFFQCSSNDNESSNEGDDGMILQEVFLMSVEVENSYFNDFQEAHLYLSDSDGEIIAEGVLSNGQTTSLSAIYDLNDRYDATVVVKSTFGSAENFTGTTFIDVRPNAHIFKSIIFFNPNSDKYILNLSNTGFPLEFLSGSTNSFGSSGSAANNGTYEYEFFLAESPGDYFALFQSVNDTAPRYFWMENIQANDSFDVDFTSLPLSSAPMTIQFPSTTNLGYEVRGFRSSSTNRFAHRIYSTSFNDFSEIYLPNDLFDYYSLSSTFKIGEITHRTHHVTEELIGSVAASEISFNISNNSVSEFAMSATGNYDTYEVGYFFNNQATEQIVGFNIYGEAANLVQFSMMNLFDTIFSDSPGLNSSQLIFSSGLLSRNNQINSYPDFIQDHFDRVIVVCLLEL